MTDSTQICLVTDPVVTAREAFDRADEALEHALSFGDTAAADACNDALIKADQVFADAVPTTEAGVRLKFAELVRALVVARGGDALTRHGADMLLLHLASLQAGWAKLRQGP